MFPLASPELPSGAIQLVEALEKGLASVLLPPPAREMVRIDAPNFPEAAHLTVDLTGCQLIEEAAKPPRDLHGFRPALSAERFVMTATPLLVRTASVRLELAASNVRFDYARDKNDRLYLVPSVTEDGGGGGDGQVRVELERADIEMLLLAAIEPIAAANGVGVEDTHVELEAESSRTVRLHVSATGKKLFMKAKVHVFGRLRIDEELNAELDDLKCEGDGFIGEMAERMIQPRLSQYNGTRIPLAAFSLGGLKLRDLNIATPDGLEITARLG